MNQDIEERMKRTLGALFKQSPRKPGKKPERKAPQQTDAGPAASQSGASKRRRVAALSCWVAMGVSLLLGSFNLLAQQDTDRTAHEQRCRDSFEIAEQRLIHADENGKVLLRATEVEMRQSCIEDYNAELSDASHTKNTEIHNAIVDYEYELDDIAETLRKCTNRIPGAHRIGRDRYRWEYYKCHARYWTSRWKAQRKRDRKIAEATAKYEESLAKFSQTLSDCEKNMETSIQAMWDIFHQWHNRQHEANERELTRCYDREHNGGR
ncbi:MAG: hypothetical protein M2R45_01576 [Verrucomicrobia subdivision 3 bacterium]|nr:hypothetical protein [Limisphaerales bacterium]MCS1412729.1 hypothetical protein [Limisphaerales bacterium]